MPVVFAAFDPIAAVIALAALLVSAATLYLTVLRHAEIEVDDIPGATEFWPPGFGARTSNGVELPVAGDLFVSLFVSNGGASSAVVERLVLTQFECVSSGAPLWTGTTDARPYENDAVPAALEAGDAKTIRFGLRLDGAPYDPEAYAARLGDLRELRLAFEWTYARSRGALWGPPRAADR